MTIHDCDTTNLESCLSVLQSIKYESYGFPVFTLTFDYSITKTWSAGFRNPANFENPTIKADTPLQACQELLAFLKTLKPKS